MPSFEFTRFISIQCHANMKIITLSNIWISWVKHTYVGSKEESDLFQIVYRTNASDENSLAKESKLYGG